MPRCCAFYALYSLGKCSFVTLPNPYFGWPQVPAWPFITASFAFGVFALMPYFTFWKPIKDQKLPPPKEDLVGGCVGPARSLSRRLEGSLAGVQKALPLWSCLQSCSNALQHAGLQCLHATAPVWTPDGHWKNAVLRILCQAVLLLADRGAVK